MALRFAAFLFLIVLAIPAVYGASHVVGGSSGWNTGVDYSTWAKGETFNVGDTLDFNYDSSHGVNVVNKGDHDNCNTGNALQSFTGGSTTITLNSTGPMYFVCSNAFHCSSGMKLTVNVANGGGSPPSSSSPPTTPDTPPSPGSTTPTTPSTPSPTARNSPSSPNGGTNAATGGLGSINHLMIGFSLVLAALAIRA